jgi:hypothetical protein
MNMSKRKIPNLYITVQEGIDFTAIQENIQIKSILYNSVFEGIKSAAETNKSEATIIELNSTGNYITLNKKDWKQSLINAQQYFIQAESYEMCADIQKLIESLDSYGPKRLHRKTSRSNKSNNRSKKYSKTS